VNPQDHTTAHSTTSKAMLERYGIDTGVDTARVMLEATTLLLRQESVGDLLRVGLERIAQMMQADAAMLHLESDAVEYFKSDAIEHLEQDASRHLEQDASRHLEQDASRHLESDASQVFTLREAFQLSPVPAVHLVHDIDPQASLPLLAAGHWITWDYPNDWSTELEQSYHRIAGVRQAAVFGLRDGTHLLGYVTLLFHTPRVFDAHSQALGGLGAIWGLQLHRLTQLADQERAQQRLALLDRVRLIVTQESNPLTMIRQTVEIIREVFGYTQVSAYLIEGRELVMQHQVGYEVGFERLPLERGVMGRVARTGHSAWLADVTQDPDFIASIADITSEICVPLTIDGVTIGVLNVETRGQRRLQREDQQLLEQLAAHVSATLQRARRELAFRSLFASNPMPMWVFDLETLGFLEVNDAALAHYGYARTEFLSLRITDINITEEVAMLSALLESRTISISPQRSWRHRLKNGSVIEVNATSHDFVFAGRAALLVVIEDITERQQANAALETSERMYRLLAENSTNLISKFDADWNCLYISPAAKGVLGFEPEELRAMPLTKSVHPDDQAVMLQSLIRASGSGQTQVTLEYRALRADGSYTWLESGFKLIRDFENGDLLEVQVSSRDITERRRVESELYRRAYVDALTGLPNRARFLDELEAAVSQPAAGVALALIDLDHFKRINDSLGHTAGDEVLCQIARRLSVALEGQGCSVARMGGDEFAVVWRDTPSLQLEGLGATLQAVLSGPVVVEGLTLFVSASVGLSHCPADAVSVRQLLRFADGSLYRAKLRGGDAFVCFTPDIASEAMERLLIEQELRRAVSDDAFTLVYQPIIDLNSERMESFEALLRWRHPTLGAVSPAQFIPIAEESGLIVAIGAWVIERACKEVSAWRVGGQPARLSVNVSMRQFAHSDFVAQVADILKRTGFAPERLTIELTESALMSDAEHVMPQLFELRDLGVRLSIDDFGVGYSNFSYLHQMPVTQLKIDKSFTDQLETSCSARALVSGMISLAHALELTVIAEGVERATQRDLLSSFGCDQAQGYLYAKPLEPLEIRQRVLDADWQRV
jgi:diguanylate cyclase (GGDEF)-like protein/PAS domain S-box-containing protein